LLRNNGDLDLALLDVEDRVRRIALRKNNLTLAVLFEYAALAEFGEKRPRIIGSNEGPCPIVIMREGV
jgi:hypothetical protein